MKRTLTNSVKAPLVFHSLPPTVMQFLFLLFLPRDKLQCKTHGREALSLKN